MDKSIQHQEVALDRIRSIEPSWHRVGDARVEIWRTDFEGHGLEIEHLGEASWVWGVAPVSGDADDREGIALIRAGSARHRETAKVAAIQAIRSYLVAECEAERGAA